MISRPGHPFIEFLYAYRLVKILILYVHKRGKYWGSWKIDERLLLKRHYHKDDKSQKDPERKSKYNNFILLVSCPTIL